MPWVIRLGWRRAAARERHRRRPATASSAAAAVPMLSQTGETFELPLSSCASEATGFPGDESTAAGIGLLEARREATAFVRVAESRLVGVDAKRVGALLEEAAKAGVAFVVRATEALVPDARTAALAGILLDTVPAVPGFVAGWVDVGSKPVQGF